MQLPGPGVFGPPADRGQALGVLRRAVEAGVDHIDTAQFYGPNVANDLIRDALSPYPEELVLVSKVGRPATIRATGSRPSAPRSCAPGWRRTSVAWLLDQVPVVNLRRHPESDVSFAAQLDAMTAMRDEGLIGAVGLSNVTLDDYRTARTRTEVACVQNAYNVTNRDEQPLVDACRADDVPFVPFFPLGSAFFPQNPVLSAPAVERTAHGFGATPAQVALAWLLAQAPTVLLIPGTSSLAHLDENLSSAALGLDEAALALLDGADRS